MAVAYALVLGMVVYGEIRLRDLHPILKKSVISSSVIMFIIANAGLFAYLIMRAGVPDAIGVWLKEVLQSPMIFLLGVNAALFIIGMFIEPSAALIVLTPILAPVAMHFGIDPVHFGIILVVNLALGMITPPFGVNLFAACTVVRISLDRIIGQLASFVCVVPACLTVPRNRLRRAVGGRPAAGTPQALAGEEHSSRTIPRPTHPPRGVASVSER